MSERDWMALAETVVGTTFEDLPLALREKARAVPVLLEEEVPDPLIEEGWPGDLLGFFEGDPVGIPAGEGTPTRIRLFLANLRAYAGDDAEVFAEEVRVTLLHELGHFLGMEEEDLEERGIG